MSFTVFALVGVIMIAPSVGIGRANIISACGNVRGDSVSFYELFSDIADATGLSVDMVILMFIWIGILFGAVGMYLSGLVSRVFRWMVG